MPLHTKLSLFAYVISGERSANQPKKLRNDAFQVKTSQSAKNQLDPAKKWKSAKIRYTPFLHKALQLYNTFKQEISKSHLTFWFYFKNNIFIYVTKFWVYVLCLIVFNMFKNLFCENDSFI